MAPRYYPGIRIEPVVNDQVMVSMSGEKATIRTAGGTTRSRTAHVLGGSLGAPLKESMCLTGIGNETKFLGGHGVVSRGYGGKGNRPQCFKHPPPSKIPTSVVEMPCT